MKKILSLTAFMLIAGLGVADAKKKPKLEMGDPAPSFRLRALDGAMVKLRDLAYPGDERSYAKKRPVLLDFFRTDCRPCLEAMPELVQVHEKYKDKGLQVILVAILEEADGRKKLQQYLARSALPFTVVVDPNDHFAKKYLGDTVSLPATFLISRHGKLMAAKYDAKGSLQEHFAEKLEIAVNPDLTPVEEPKPKKKKRRGKKKRRRSKS